MNWCKELKYDLNNMFFYFPKNFKKVHDRTAAEYQAVQDKKAAEKKRQEEERIKREAEVMKKLLEEMLKENAGIDNAFLIKGKGLILRVPRDAQEIKNEGAALHHCVGTYVDRVAKGQTHIFFVRREEEPDTPYFTMEYNNGRVIQCTVGIVKAIVSMVLRNFADDIEKNNPGAKELRIWVENNSTKPELKEEIKVKKPNMK